jgi:hypothetical protein
MGKFSDLTGEFIGQLFVLGRMENGPRNDTRWECLCMCGNIKPVHGRNLKWGATKSCGCMRESRDLVERRGYVGRAVIWGIKIPVYSTEDVR